MVLTSFEKRLLAVLVLLGLLQGLIFGAFVWAYQLPVSVVQVFVPAHLAYHLVLLFALWSIRGDHKRLDGTPLARLGVPNLLTLYRLTSLPVMATLFLLARELTELAVPLVVYIATAFLTDLADGFLARTFGWGTQLGKVLDSSTDYLIVFSLALVLGATGVLPLWLLATIVFRLGFQVGGLAWLQATHHKRVVETTFLGKASLFVLMVLFAAEILVFLRLPGWENSLVVTSMEIFTAVVMLISTVDKFLFFRKHSRPPVLMPNNP